MIQKIKFKGKEYILVNGDSITTEESYINGTVSFAHLCKDGTVKRYGKVIGLGSDIEFDEEIEIKPTREGFMNLLTGRTWF
jgi:hypothetical protein